VPLYGRFPVEMVASPGTPGCYEVLMATCQVSGQ